MRVEKETNVPGDYYEVQVPSEDQHPGLVMSERSFFRVNLSEREKMDVDQQEDAEILGRLVRIEAMLKELKK